MTWEIGWYWLNSLGYEIEVWGDVSRIPNVWEKYFD